MSVNRPNRLVVITNGNYFARLILDGVLSHYSNQIVGILIITGDYKARTSLRALWELGRVTAWPYIGYKLMTYVAFSLAQRLYPQAAFSVRSLAKDKGIPVRESVSVKSPDVLEWLTSQSADLLVSVSCPQMIGRKLLAASRLGGINIHSSLLPQYAGIAPYYWVLAAGERETGTSVHYMTLKFDEGNILAQRRVVIEPAESAFDLFKRLAIAGNEAMQEALPMALAENPGVKQDLTGYTYYSNPSFESYRALRLNRHVLVRVSEVLATIREEIHRQHA